MLVWGVNFSVVKAALGQFSPLAFNGIRFVLGSLVLVPFVTRRGGLPDFSRREMVRLAGLGLLGNTVYQVLFIEGIDATLAGNAALMLAMAPVFVTLLSAALRHERVLPAGWIGVLLSVAGIGLVLADAAAVEFGGETLRGDLIMLVAAVAWAIYTVGASPLVRRHGALPVTAVTMWIGAVFLVLVSVPAFIGQDWGATTPLGWTALVGSGLLAIGLAYVIWYYGVEHLGSARTAVFSNTVPIVALVVAWATLSEVPTGLQLLGAALIVGGVTLTRLRGTEQALRHAEPHDLVDAGA